MLSPVASILAATVPSQMGIVTTSVDAATGGLKIVWTNPSSNGTPITSYLIEIQDSSSTWRTQTTYCDGNNNVVFFNRYCIIPISTLTNAPFTLALGTLVQVRALALSTYGQSTPSYVNTLGARVRTVPAQMTSPVRGSDTSESQIQLTWASLTGTNTGHSDILSYAL